MNRNTNGTCTNGTRARQENSWMHRRAALLLLALLAAGFVASGMFSSAPAGQATRRAINLPDKPPFPFSDAIQAGNTLYMAGRLGVDAKTGKVPAEVDEEIKLLLDGVKAVLAQAGMSMDDLVYVQISCTDLSLFEKFNGVYRTYFTTKDLPAREFIGAAALLRGAHFELQAIAVRK